MPFFDAFFLCLILMPYFDAFFCWYIIACQSQGVSMVLQSSPLYIFAPSLVAVFVARFVSLLKDLSSLYFLRLIFQLFF